MNPGRGIVERVNHYEEVMGYIQAVTGAISRRALHRIKFPIADIFDEMNQADPHNDPAEWGNFLRADE